MVGDHEELSENHISMKFPGVSQKPSLFLSYFSDDAVSYSSLCEEFTNLWNFKKY